MHHQLVDARSIYATTVAFAAVKKDGTVVTWGRSGFRDQDGEWIVQDGGDCSELKDQLVDVRSIYSTDIAFAALKADGTVVAWGSNAKAAKALALNRRAASKAKA